MSAFLPALSYCTPRTLHPPISHLFPYTTLFRSSRRKRMNNLPSFPLHNEPIRRVIQRPGSHQIINQVIPSHIRIRTTQKLRLDRKSTRLNSSHVSISYAVFCLKKKKQKITTSTE